MLFVCRAIGKARASMCQHQDQSRAFPAQRLGAAARPTQSANGIVMAIEASGHKDRAPHRKYEDSTTRPQRGQWTAEQEAAKPTGDQGSDVMVYIGPLQTRARRRLDAQAQQEGILMVPSPANTWPASPKPGKGEPRRARESTAPPGRSTTSAGPADDHPGRRSADWAQKLGLNKVFIDDARSTGRARGPLQARDEEIGRRFWHEGIDARAQEFKPPHDEDQGVRDRS